MDNSFLSEDVDKWPELSSYINAKRIAESLKVINDCAERAIAMATTFNSSLTKEEKQKQYLFQAVEEHCMRRSFPNSKKITLRFSNKLAGSRDEWRTLKDKKSDTGLQRRSKINSRA